MRRRGGQTYTVHYDAVQFDDGPKPVRTLGTHPRVKASKALRHSTLNDGRRYLTAANIVGSSVLPPRSTIRSYRCNVTLVCGAH